MRDPQITPGEIAAVVAEAIRSARVSYADVASELVRLRDASEAERVAGLDGLRRVSRELGVALTVLARTVEQLSGSRRLPAAEDPRNALALLRALADSLVMLDAPDWGALIARPIASPQEIERLAAVPATARFLARQSAQ